MDSGSAVLVILDGGELTASLRSLIAEGEVVLFKDVGGFVGVGVLLDRCCVDFAPILSSPGCPMASCNMRGADVRMGC